jgi:hypothetical protein
MSQKHINEMKPFLSVLLIVGTLFLIVFAKMEVRRMGYSFLKISREYKALEDRQRLLTIRIAKSMRADRVRSLAEGKLSLLDATGGRIIQLSGDQVAIRQ